MTPAALDPADRPLIVTCFNEGGAEWTKQAGRLARWHEGALLAVVQNARSAEPADVALTLRPLATADEARALTQAALAHPAPAADALPESIGHLAQKAAALWNVRRAD